MTLKPGNLFVIVGNLKKSYASFFILNLSFKCFEIMNGSFGSLLYDKVIIDYS